jgi:hypothetical protein
MEPLTQTLSPRVLRGEGEFLRAAHRLLPIVVQDRLFKRGSSESGSPSDFLSRVLWERRPQEEGESQGRVAQ